MVLAYPLEFPVFCRQTQDFLLKRFFNIARVPKARKPFFEDTPPIFVSNPIFSWKMGIRVFLGKSFPRAGWEKKPPRQKPPNSPVGRKKLSPKNKRGGGGFLGPNGGAPKGGPPEWGPFRGGFLGGRGPLLGAPPQRGPKTGEKTRGKIFSTLLGKPLLKNGRKFLPERGGNPRGDLQRKAGILNVFLF